MINRNITASLIQRINQAKNISTIEQIIEPYKDMLTDSVLQAIFEQISEVDEDGFGTMWLINDLVDISPKFKTSNGLSWARSDGSLGREYLIDRVKQQGRSYSVQLIGYNQNAVERNIPQAVRDYFTDAVCALTGTGEQIEIDHKDGRYLTHYTAAEDFQPLHRNVNLIKRQHCKKCKETNHRFDAKSLGFQQSHTTGTPEWELPLGCKGCFWYDIRDFRQKVSTK